MKKLVEHHSLSLSLQYPFALTTYPHTKQNVGAFDTYKTKSIADMNTKDLLLKGGLAPRSRHVQPTQEP